MLSIGFETASVANQKLKIVSKELCTDIRAEFEHFIKEDSTSGTLPSIHDVYVKAIMRFSRWVNSHDWAMQHYTVNR